MSRAHTLLKNTLIFAIGSIGSKLMQFFLLPLYTRTLTSSQYGITDIIQNVAMLLVPIFSADIADAVFRYGMDNEVDKKQVLSIGIYLSLFGSAALSLFGLLFQYFNNTYADEMWLIIFLSTSIIIRSALSQFIRAIGELRLFTFDNLLQAFSVFALNICFLLFFHWGIFGYTLGYICSNWISVCILVFFGRIWKYIGIIKIRSSITKQMLLFSAPLIPNTVCWWVSNSADRLMISHFLGSVANGIYAVSYKIPTAVTIIAGVFFQAWQISANQEYKKRDINIFYQNVFEYLQITIILISSIIIVFSKVITKLLASSAFYDSWRYMPILILAMAFFSFGQFLGSVYTAFKNTFMAFVTNGLTAVINTVLNIILIPKIGIIGAAISTAVSYLILWLYRLLDTRRMIIIKYDKIRLFINSVLLTGQAIAMTAGLSAFSFAFLVLIIIINWKMIKKISVDSIKKIKSYYVAKY